MTGLLAVQSGIQVPSGDELNTELAAMFGVVIPGAAQRLPPETETGVAPVTTTRVS
jgi:hypothetical protein